MSLSKAIFHLVCMSDVRPAVDNPWGKKIKLANAQLSNFEDDLAVCIYAEDK